MTQSLTTLYRLIIVLLTAALIAVSMGYYSLHKANAQHRSDTEGLAIEAGKLQRENAHLHNEVRDQSAERAFMEERFLKLQEAIHEYDPRLEVHEGREGEIWVTRYPQ